MENCLSPKQVQHLYECLKKDITYNPTQANQYVQLNEPELPDFLLHIDEEEDPMPCYAMTNPYEVLYSRIGSVKYTPLSCNGSIGDKELEYQRFFYNVFI